jgi:hypothetical protein
MKDSREIRVRGNPIDGEAAFLMGVAIGGLNVTGIIKASAGIMFMAVTVTRFIVKRRGAAAPPASGVPRHGRAGAVRTARASPAW